ncbi:hypothetical protein AMECASPLE_023399 [Ameca splendens]|uniref:Uncharacterized protein n=1 Tax=Ameca splendens TaxID=208324 RepID=A0ABV0YFR7_9TELE
MNVLFKSQKLLKSRFHIEICTFLVILHHNRSYETSIASNTGAIFKISVFSFLLFLHIGPAEEHKLKSGAVLCSCCFLSRPRRPEVVLSTSLQPVPALCSA